MPSALKKKEGKKERSNLQVGEQLDKVVDVRTKRGGKSKELRGTRSRSNRGGKLN